MFVLKLTPRRQEALDKLRHYYAQYGVPPSVRDLAVMMGITVSTAYTHLEALAQLGEVTRHRGMFIPTATTTTSVDGSESRSE